MPTEGTPASWADESFDFRRWHIRPGLWWGLENLDIIDDPTGRFRKVLRVRYPAGSASPAVTREFSHPVGGVQFFADCGLPPADTRALRYYVRFGKDFRFARGGKLPGLCGGTMFSGGRTPTGGDGFSTRYMWREDGVGELYVYRPGCGAFGESIGRGAWRFTPEIWHRLEQHVSLNTPGLADGRIRVWFDGRHVLDAGSLSFRTIGSLRIEALFFSTFFGGSDRTWVSPADTVAYFAGLALDNGGMPSGEPLA